MIYLLDTNILIYLIKKKPPQVADRIDALPEEDQLAMSFVTWAELLQGAAGSFPRPRDQLASPDLGQLELQTRKLATGIKQLDLL